MLHCCFPCVAAVLDAEPHEDTTSSDTSNRRALHGARCESPSYPWLRACHTLARKFSLVALVAGRAFADLGAGDVALELLVHVACSIEERRFCIVAS